MIKFIDKYLIFLRPFQLHPVNPDEEYLVAFELSYWYFIWVNRKLYSVPKNVENENFKIITKERT